MPPTTGKWAGDSGTGTARGTGRGGKGKADMTLAVSRIDGGWRTFGRISGDDELGHGSSEYDLGCWQRPEPDGVEHEVRGLLNLVQLVSYCLRNCPATGGQRAQWRREVAWATRRLRRIHVAGWCPALLR